MVQSPAVLLEYGVVKAIWALLNVTTSKEMQKQNFYGSTSIKTSLLYNYNY